MTIQFRYKLPTPYSCVRAETRSFGIEPFNTETKRKVAKAIVRLVMHIHTINAEADAAAVADRIVELLNAGCIYMGPKALHFDWQRKHTPQSVEGYFKQPGESW